MINDKKNMKKTNVISILVSVDVIGLLASDSLEGNVYLFDNNRANGSINEGTDKLKTKLTFKHNSNITLIWDVIAIEPEAFIEISDISLLNNNNIEITRHRYEESDISYWQGIVKKPFDKLTYKIAVNAGNRDQPFFWDIDLIGETESL